MECFDSILPYSCVHILRAGVHHRLDVGPGAEDGLREYGNRRRLSDGLRQRQPLRLPDVRLYRGTATGHDALQPILHHLPVIVSDIAIFVLKRDVKLQPTNLPVISSGAGLGRRRTGRSFAFFRESSKKNNVQNWRQRF